MLDSLKSGESDILDVLCEREFKFLALNEKPREISSSSAQTPSMVMGATNVMSEAFLRSSSFVEIKVALGQLVSTLNISSLLTARSVSPLEHSTSGFSKKVYNICLQCPVLSMYARALERNFL